MSYDYETQKSKVLTPDGQKMLFAMRAAADKLIASAGCVRMDALMSATSGGDTWTMLACADYLIEMGEFIEIEQSRRPAGQHRIFTKYRRG